MAEYASVVWMKCWFDSGTGLREVEELVASPVSGTGADVGSSPVFPTRQMKYKSGSTMME